MAIKRIVAIVVVVAIAALIRFVPLDAKCLWLDEAISAFYLNYSCREIFTISEASGSLHPPLFFLLLRGWSSVWGDSEFALRFLPALAGTLSVGGLYLLMRQLEEISLEEGQKRPNAAILATAMLALSPLQVHLSQIVRHYTIASALLLFESSLLLKALRGGRPYPPILAIHLGAGDHRRLHS